MQRLDRNHFPGVRHFTRAAVLLVFALIPSLARADLFVSVEPVNLSPSTTGGFDVILSNTGPDVTIGGFAFQLTTSTPGVTFTAVDGYTATIGYIFESDSLFGQGNIDNTPAPGLPGTLVAALDLSTQIFDTIPSGFLLDQNESIGLGRVSYLADSTASGPLSIAFDFPATNLSDPNGNDIPVSVAQSVPEPNTFLMAVQSTLMAAGICRWRLGRRNRTRRLEALLIGEAW